jgi:hypothetical protein
MVTGQPSGSSIGRPRIQDDGATHHVMSRENRHQDIFLDAQGTTFLTLPEASDRVGGTAAPISAGKRPAGGLE